MHRSAANAAHRTELESLCNALAGEAEKVPAVAGLISGSLRPHPSSTHARAPVAARLAALAATAAPLGAQWKTTQGRPRARALGDDDSLAAVGAQLPEAATQPVLTVGADTGSRIWEQGADTGSRQQAGSGSRQLESARQPPWRPAGLHGGGGARADVRSSANGFSNGTSSSLASRRASSAGRAKVPSVRSSTGRSPSRASGARRASGLDPHELTEAETRALRHLLHSNPAVRLSPGRHSDYAVQRLSLPFASDR
ncbi:hypothetical protein T492DRAFT_857251 [Pavlovales sp. CCMP2436]|nr:hypothetical protein T492DRAFT_857251 [Pavlovales sp. CCMP2436]